MPRPNAFAHDPNQMNFSALTLRVPVNFYADKDGTGQRISARLRCIEQDDMLPRTCHSTPQSVSLATDEHRGRTA